MLAILALGEGLEEKLDELLDRMSDWKLVPCSDGYKIVDPLIDETDCVASAISDAVSEVVNNKVEASDA